jgi:transcription initiation factor TFIIH subunit 2
MDYRPSRMAVVAKHAEAFIREFFDQNPLSHVGLVTIKDGISHRLTEMGGSPESQIKALMGKLECSGDSSLQNALELVHGYLNQVPSYGHKEVLILYSALNTCDPGNIMETIEECKKSKIRCSVIGLAAEIFVCKHLCEETGGSYTVALDEVLQCACDFTFSNSILLRSNDISFLFPVSFQRIAAGACSPTSCYSRICCS